MLGARGSTVLSMLGRWRPDAACRGLTALLRALDEAPRPVCFWWRDDDAGRMIPGFDQILALAGRLRIPIGLGVVPDWLEPMTIERIRACPMAEVLQHGWSHANHGGPREHPIEIGGMLAPSDLPDRLAQGRCMLERAFGRQLVPILVPPWNLVARPFVTAVDDLGFSALSAAAGITIPGLRTPRLDAHIDIVCWYSFLRHVPGMLARAGRLHRCRGVASLAAEITAWVRSGRAAPIGVLTHHQLLDKQGLTSLEQILMTIRDHPNARWMSPGEIVAGQRRLDRPKAAKRKPVPA